MEQEEYTSLSNFEGDPHSKYNELNDSYGTKQKLPLESQLLKARRELKNAIQRNSEYSIE